ncbi:MAG: DUF4965 domain-containing protein [Clostridia bacterium]|nr:DUF4965 domain-containing protein [Clostridia bacterium]
MRLPAYPIITHDPFFSLWQTSDYPTAEDLSHWDGTKKTIRGTIEIDGISRRFFGRTGKQAMKLLDTVVTPLSTSYILEDLGVRLSLSFTSPLLPDDLDILSAPITFMNMEVSFTDGKEHCIRAELCFPGTLCHSGERQPELRLDCFSDGVLHYGYMGDARQALLSGSGDHDTCSWGYFFVAAEDGIDEHPEAADVMLRCRIDFAQKKKATLLLGYDQIAVINYFGRALPDYYARNGKTITEALREFHARKEELLNRCEAFDRKLLADAGALGGEEYAQIVTAAYRQTVCGHKLCAGPDGELLFISKENDSNGCAATVDVSYPSAPLFLLYCPELVRAMLRPILKFARMPVWEYDYAPHDAGRYPIVTGQIYAAYLRTKHQACGVTHAPYYLYPAGVDAYNPTKQMPLEESANMILMTAACGFCSGDYTFAEEHMDLLETWKDYLLLHTEDPENQLCTDDFAGHLAGNVNLSAKGILAVAAFGMIQEKLGHAEQAEMTMKTARRMAETWLRRAKTGNHTRLAFGAEGWSVKYNLVWDRLFGFNLFPEEFYREETKSYLCRMNRYGLPLDSRSKIGKTDWTLWAASMADKEDFHAFIDPVAAYLSETSSRVPFSDFYDTEIGTYERFIARTVQGGVFMPLLMEKYRK